MCEFPAVLTGMFSKIDVNSMPFVVFILSVGPNAEISVWQILEILALDRNLSLSLSLSYRATYCGEVWNRARSR